MRSDKGDSGITTDRGTGGVRAVLVGARYAMGRACVVHAYSEIRAIGLLVPIAGIGC